MAKLAELYPYPGDDVNGFPVLVPDGLDYNVIHFGARTWTYGTNSQWGDGSKPVIYSGCLSRHLVETPDPRNDQAIIVRVL